MLREEVLKGWGSLKEKIEGEWKFCDFVVGEKMRGGGVIPDFSFDLDDELQEWTDSEYIERLEEEKVEIIEKGDKIDDSSLVANLQLAYFNFYNMFWKLNMWRLEKEEEWRDIIRIRAHNIKAVINRLKNEAERQPKDGRYFFASELEKYQYLTQKWEDRFNSLKNMINNFDYERDILAISDEDD